MEERIIDDEYGRGIKLKKTADGYVDATDELTKTEETEEEIVADEVVFEFPDLDEDDEELATLTPEQAEELKKRRAEEMKKLEEEYLSIVAEADALLAEKDYAGAEEKYSSAIAVLPARKEASVGYWRSKTQDFTNPDVMADEYAEYGYDDWETEFGREAKEALKTAYGEVFEERIRALKEQEAPLAEEYEERKKKRDGILRSRTNKARNAFLPAFACEILVVVLTAVFALNINSRPDSLFVILTVASGVAVFLCLPFLCLTASKYVNLLKMLKANGKLSSTEQGAELEKIRQSLDFYNGLVS